MNDLFSASPFYELESEEEKNMAKFCRKCGTKLDQVTGLCPKCDAERLARLPAESVKEEEKQKVSAEPEKPSRKKQKKADKKAAKKAKKKEKWASMTFGQKVRRVFLKLLLGSILLIAFACGIVGTLMYFQIVDFPIIDRFISESKIMNYAESVEREVPETNISDFTLHHSSETNIVTDVEQGVTFVNNEVLVTIDSSKDKQKLENYISRIGGTIVGEIPELADYQILLDKEYGINELRAIVTELSEQAWVVSAVPNYCIKIDAQYVPNDKKWSKKWDDVPDGTNWGVEAIDIQEAWNYQSDMTTTVNVGVIDNMFDVNHEDLVFSEAPLGNVLAINDSDWSNHGTHTAGTIAATTNNKVGIAGISINDNLYGVSYVGLAVGGYDTLQSMKIALYYLIATNNCAVINMSIGTDHLTFEASRGGVVATNELNNLASGIENLLQQLIDRDYQFVICKSAGNQNEVGGGYQYFRKGENDDYPYEYYSYSDYLKYLSGESGYEYFAKYKDKRTAIEQRLESGNVDAKYDFLGIISNQEVKNRIIVVGAAESLGTHKEGGFLWFGRKNVHNGYSIASFSQCGNRVDVLAPGVDIYSCVKNGYASMSGTSMAAPHVSGVASLLFSVNPNLSADNVKSIICDTAVGSYGNEKYGLLNAKNAVEAALNYIPSSDQAGETGGKFELTDIPSDAAEFNGHYYILYDESMTWQEARDACELVGGHLITITEQKEQEFISNYVQGAAKRSYWIGLSDEEENDNWTWVTGEPLSYSNWAINEPNHGRGGVEHYVAIVSYDTFYNYEVLLGQWNDHENNDEELYQFGYICEWESDTSLPNDKPSQEPDHTTADSALKKYIEAANKTTAAGSWTEDMTMKAQMLLKNGDSTVNAKINMDASVDISGWNGTDTSSLYMSGWANMSVLNQEIAYTMTWKNGMAHYKYTKPSVTETDMEVDPSFFNIHSLTEDMILSSSIFGNQIELTVKGDELTKIGVATAGEMLQGVTNLSYSDAIVHVSVSRETGAIDTVIMTFSVSMNMQEYDVKADYEVHYAFSENAHKNKDEEPIVDHSGSARDMWLNYLSSGEYKKFTTGWANLWDVEAYGNAPYPTEYAIIDIDGDGWEELVLYRSQNDGLGFGYHSVLSCDKSTGKIRIVPIESRMEESGASFDEITQNFRGVSYSPSYHALVYTELNNGRVFSDYGYWIIEDGRLVSHFCIGHDGYSGVYSYFAMQDGKSWEISEEEHSNYIADWETLDFYPLNDIEAASGVNQDLPSGTIETPPESSHPSSILGVWDSIDGKQRMIFSSKGSFTVSYEYGIQNADGSTVIIDLQKGKRNVGGFAINGDSIILTIDMQQKSLNYSLSGDSLSIGDLSFCRVEKALANQLVGTWENHDRKFEFDDEGYVTITRGTNYERGVYAILSESKIMFNIDGNGASTYDYSVDGKTFSFGNQQYIKDGDNSDYNEVIAAKDILVGTWKSDATGEYYVFRSDGIYEYYAFESLYRIGQVTKEGLYDIVSTSTIKVYQDMSGDFYSEFTLEDSVLISDSYSSSVGGNIQYTKVK